MVFSTCISIAPTVSRRSIAAVLCSKAATSFGRIKRTVRALPISNVTSTTTSGRDRTAATTTAKADASYSTPLTGASDIVSQNSARPDALLHSDESRCCSPREEGGGGRPSFAPRGAYAGPRPADSSARREKERLGSRGASVLGHVAARCGLVSGALMSLGREQSSAAGRLSYMSGRVSGLRGVKIYTKTGDKGTSATYSGHRRAKFDAIFEAVGTSDELSSSIGHARSFMRDDDRFDKVEAELCRIQCILQDLQSSIATPVENSPEPMLEKVRFDPSNVTYLETCIDAHSAQLPPLKNFILPGGGPAASALQVARCVARRAERCFARLTSQERTDSNCAIFLNRVSDYLFTAARVASYIEGGRELIYK